MRPRIEVLGVAAVGADRRFPPAPEVVGLVGRHHLGHAVRVAFDVEALAMVLGELNHTLAIGRGQVEQEHAVRFGPGKADREVVESFDRGVFAVDDVDIARPLRVDRRVGLDALPPEQNVGGGEGHAVGPLQPFAQLERVGGGVVTDFPALGHVRDDFRAVDRPSNQRFIAVVTHVADPSAAVGVDHLATVDADPFGGRHHEGGVGQPLLHRRQPSGGDQGGEHRRLPVGCAFASEQRRRCEHERRNGACPAEHSEIHVTLLRPVGERSVQSVHPSRYRNRTV